MICNPYQYCDIKLPWLKMFVQIDQNNDFKTMNCLLLCNILDKTPLFTSKMMTWQNYIITIWVEWPQKRFWRETKLYRCFLYLQLQGKDRREAESRVWCSSAHACPEGRERQNLTASGQHAEPGELHTAR